MYPKMNEFSYWFHTEVGGNVTVYKRGEDGGWIRLKHSCTETSLEDMEDIYDDWKRYQNRPEYYVGRIHLMEAHSEEEAYDTLLSACCLVRAFNNGVEDVDGVQKNIDKILNWLHGTDFYHCPASTIYHDSTDKGLIKHSISVAKKSHYLLDSCLFPRVSYESIYLLSLVHDWCKIGLYESYMRNIKNEETGRWEQKLSYRRKQDFPLSLGHGVSSLFLSQKFFNLTLAESLAIRWHQGRWNVCESELNEYQQSNEIAPEVLLLQFADQLAITRY